MIFKHWLNDLRTHLVGCCVALAIAAGTTSACHAQVMLPQGGEAQAAVPTDPAVLKMQLEMQQRQIDELKRIVESRGLQPASVSADGNVSLDENAVKRIAEGVLKAKEAEKKAADEAAKAKKEAEGYKVGTDLGMSVRWNPNSGLVAETANKDFFIHLGGRFQWDTVAFTESPSLKNSSFGDLQDGTFFRRVRIQMDGQAWEIMEFNLEYALEQVQQGVPNLDEFWVGVKSVPFIGTVRAGHIKVPQGLEGDVVSSSKAMTFMERSMYTDAFYQNFATGVWASNNYFDQHATWEAAAYRQDNDLNGNNGTNFSDGKWAFTGRATALPYYSEDGSCFLHLGASATYRKAEDPDPGLTGPGVIRFRARPELRDAIGDFGSTVNGVALPGNASRLVDTGAIAADSATVIGTEFWFNRGPLAIVGEWAFAQMNDATVGGVKQGTLAYNGGYIQAGYFLTGEHRTYDRRFGRIATNYFEGPTTPFWLVRGEDGSISRGLGAFEIAARYNYLNLNDGPVQGGVVNSVNIGLNWYLNQNLKIQFEYIDANRWNEKGAPSGDIQGFGTRLQVQF